MLKVGVVGIGNCGNQIATLAQKECGCQVYAINTSENDLATLPESVPKKLVGDAQGSGKSREAAKKFLKKEVANLVGDDSFAEFLASQEVIIIASSVGGGTGSGMSPILAEIIRGSFLNRDGSMKVVLLVGILPKLSEGYSTQVNALDYLNEVKNKMDKPTYLIYDNNNYANESGFRVLQKVNQEVVEDIKVLQCKYNLSTPFDSIDEKDMRQIQDTPGRMVVVSLRDFKEKDLDSTSIEQMLIDTMKKNAHTEMQRDMVISRTGLISNLSEKINGQLDTNLREVRKFVGEPIEEFVHTAINDERNMPNNVSLILTGLSPIDDRMDKIRDRIAEIEEAQEREERLVDVEDDIEAMNAKRGYRQKQSSDATMLDAESIFGKFGV